MQVGVIATYYLGPADAVLEFEESLQKSF